MSIKSIPSQSTTKAAPFGTFECAGKYFTATATFNGTSQVIDASIRPLIEKLVASHFARQPNNKGLLPLTLDSQGVRFEGPTSVPSDPTHTYVSVHNAAETNQWTAIANKILTLEEVSGRSSRASSAASSTESAITTLSSTDSTSSTGVKGVEKEWENLRLNHKVLILDRIQKKNESGSLKDTLAKYTPLIEKRWPKRNREESCIAALSDLLIANDVTAFDEHSKKTLKEQLTKTLPDSEKEHSLEQIQTFLKKTALQISLAALSEEMIALRKSWINLPIDNKIEELGKVYLGTFRNGQTEAISQYQAFFESEIERLRPAQTEEVTLQGYCITLLARLRSDATQEGITALFDKGASLRQKQLDE